eukprot:g4280.t1
MSSRKLLTLVCLIAEDQALLGMKKRGFGVGKWNGFGGKVEPGETIFDGAMREIQEECGVTPTDMTLCGVLSFDYPDKSCRDLLVHVYRASAFTGAIQESEEMRPQWFPIDKIPYKEMWEDDYLWWPLLLEKKNFTGTFTFKDTYTMVSHDVKHFEGSADDLEMYAKRQRQVNGGDAIE